ncbi:peptidoglycan-N-acetylglucosamine deacetylase [Nematocida sp. AWRm77]|nr:peptidoglycan-N-acetylglucosamine deacetylase [Nematocida sp. AWRm77]
MCALGALCYRAPSTCVKKGDVALVFSDGPVTGTPNLINTLGEDNIQATFMFSLANIENDKVQDVIRYALEEGHTVGLRVSVMHDFAGESEETVRDSIEKEVSVMEEVMGEKLRYISINQDDVSNQKVLKAINELDLVLINYNYDMYGTLDNGECDQMVDNWARKLKTMSAEKASYIVLQHDQRESEIEIVPRIVGAGRDEGFRFVSMDECLAGADMGDENTAGHAGGADTGMVIEKRKKSGALAPATIALGLLALLVLFY